MKSNLVACLFGGQGMLNFDILSRIKQSELYRNRFQTVCNVLDKDTLRAIEEEDPNVIKKNEVSSLLTVLIGSVLYDLYCKRNKLPSYLAGYSVGQWAALYASGVLSFESLVGIVKSRAEIMNRCITQNPSCMIAVIGLHEDTIRKEIKKLQDKGYFVEISNYNCIGQYTLSATIDIKEELVSVLESLMPKKVVILPMSGGWHSSLLEQGEKEFLKYLEGIKLLPMNIPVINNVDGKILPSNLNELRIQLAKHISHPVLWEEGIKTLIRFGCTDFVEVSYDNTLTKFGFFIDRSLKHTVSDLVESF